MHRIRLLIVDDHAVVRQGLQMIAQTEPAIQVVGEARGGKEAVHQAGQLEPDVILMDLVMPDGDGIEALARIKSTKPYIKIIVLTTYKEDYRIKAALAAGADGYLLKDADGEVVLEAIKAAYRGEMPFHPFITRQLLGDVVEDVNPDPVGRLTKRQREILQLVARGLSNKDVAQKLSLTEGTVKIHVSRILSKLNASSRTEAAMLAVQLGIISPRGN